MSKLQKPLMNEKKIAEMAKWKLLGHNSCVGCKFLYMQDVGYSNYTVENTDVICALNKNRHLPAGMPYDWVCSSDGNDNWGYTNNSRCERFAEREGDLIHLDIDGNTYVEDFTSDPEVIAAIRDN